mgnify:CR=1 FL=1
MTDNTIPKIIHQIWLGGQIIPKQIVNCMKSCREKHPGWQYILWTEENLPSIVHFRQEWDLDQNYARKSDLLRLQVLYDYGGVYLDTDMECIKPIDGLMEGHTMVMATECSHIKDDEIFDPDNCDNAHINNAVIACTPNNQVIKEIMTKIKQKYRSGGVNTTGGPKSYVAKLSGPVIYNSMRLRKDNRVKMYPNTYFYPIHYSNRLPMEQWNIPTNPKTLDNDTYMIHHFAASWYNQK